MTAARNYREVFFAHNGTGPFKCIFCSTEVTFDVVIVHHVDLNRMNCDASNLAAAHYSCHQAYHNTKRSSGYSRQQNISDDERARRSRATAENWENPDYRAKVIKGNTGQIRSAEQRARMSESAKRRNPDDWARHSETVKALWKSDEYRAKVALGHKKSSALTWCECGAGPFKGRRGVLLHQRRSREVSGQHPQCRSREDDRLGALD